jgi:hypothetical protein
MNPMDVGKYGSLYLMKRYSQDIVTVFPIDDEEVTFGCDPKCSVRLYYDDIDVTHCKIIFQERKVRVSTNWKPVAYPHHPLNAI